LTTEKLDLEQQLRRAGSARLARLVGHRRLEQIDDVLRSGVNEASMSKILLARFGTEILSQRPIRQALLSTLNSDQLSRVAPTAEAAPIDAKPVDIDWGWSSEEAHRLLDLFDLGDEYLPVQRESPPSLVYVEPEVGLFEHQRLVKDDLVRSMLSGHNRLLLHMPTGAGKTRTTVEGLIDLWRSSLRRGSCVVWLAHSEELCEQAFETIEALWLQRGDGPLRLVRLWGSHQVQPADVEGAFVVASLQKIFSMRSSQSDLVFSVALHLRNACQLVVIDEAHKAIAPTYRQSIEFVGGTNPRVVGLTATPGRGADPFQNAELARFFESRKVSLRHESGEPVANPIRHLQQHGFLARIVRRQVPTDVTMDLSDQERIYLARFLDLPPSVLKRLGEDATRNACILAQVSGLVDEGCSALVFACSVDHAHLLSELLLLRGVASRCVDGTTPRLERQRAVADFREGGTRVLVNYGVLTTGFDAPNTNAVVIARPTGSLVLYSQMIGRGIRGPQVGGNDRCVLVDLRDNIEGFPDEQNAFSAFDTHWSD